MHLAGFEPMITLKLTRLSCHRLFESNSVFPDPIRPSVSRVKTEILKSLFTCLRHVWRGRHRRLSQKIESTNGGYQPTKFEPKPSIGLACTLGYNFFCYGLRDRAWHLVPATDWSETGTIIFPPFQHIEGIFVHPDLTSHSGSRGKSAWTDRHTYILEVPIGIQIFGIPKLLNTKSVFGRTTANFVGQLGANTATIARFSEKNC